MGKQQQTKKKQDRREARHNPVRVPDAHLGQGAGSAKAHPAKEQALLPIIDKLSAPDAADRVWACAAVSNLIQNDPSTRRLLQGKNIVGALITRLTDSTEDVVVEAAGALRNLCIDGGYDLCAEVYNKGVLSPLTVLIGQISGTLDRIFSAAPVDPKKDVEEIAKRKLVFDLAENVITILWCLSETSERALTAVNNLSLTPFLLSFLSSRQGLPIRLVTSAAHSLYVLTDDNPAAVTHLRSDGSWINTLVDVIRYGAKAEGAVEEEDKKGKGKAAAMTGVEGNEVEQEEQSDMLLRVLASGTIRHISPLPPLLPVAALDLEKTLIIPLLDQLLDLDLAQVSASVAQLSADLPDAATIAAQLKDPKTDHKTQSERSLEAIEKKLTTLQIGLEVLMGICSKVPEDKDEDDDEVAPKAAEEEDEDEMMADEGDEEMDEEDLIAQGREQPADISLIEADGDATLPLPTTLVTLLQTLNLPARLLALSAPTPLSFLPVSTATQTPSSLPSSHPPTTSLLSTIHLRSLETLNNLLMSITFFIPASTSAEYTSPEWTAFFAHSRSSLQPVWNGLFAVAGVVAPSPEMLSVKGQEMRAEILEVCLGGLMGVAGITRGRVDVADGQVAQLIGAHQGSLRESLKVRALGTLSALGMKDVDVTAQTIANNKLIGTYLLSILTGPSPSADSMVAALNGIFDIYADETAPWDVEVFRKGGFLDGLKSSVSKVRAITRGIDKRKTPELRARADEAYENLAAFIKYRRSVA